MQHAIACYPFLTVFGGNGCTAADPLAIVSSLALIALFLSGGVVVAILALREFVESHRGRRGIRNRRRAYAARRSIHRNRYL